MLPKIIEIIDSNCVNCHSCISVCPVKYCMDGTKDTINYNSELCIGCGECIKACTHDARKIIDDFDKAMTDLKNKEKIIAISAPAAAANFPDNFMNLNGWLKSLGIKAVFDVSFGAELTIRSYLEHIKTNKPEMVISQPCPAIVTFIQIYHPELLPYLAPADSPMMHTMKMIREFYPQYKDHKILIVSPCIAKKREFIEVGIGDYNVTMTSINKYFEKEKINLADFPVLDFDNEPAERAVIFSTPGGLMRTAERDYPDIISNTRKIEGPEIIYRYLEKLNIQREKGFNPLLVDCLNCENGCNGGTGTDNQDKSPDEQEHYIEARKKFMQKLYEKTNILGHKNVSIKKITRTINKYWNNNLYGRKYADLSSSDNVIIPDNNQIKNIYETMMKFNEIDFKNCSSCGYNTCEKMAVAVFNGLNKKENCHFYISKQIETQIIQEKELINKLNNEIIHVTSAIEEIGANMNSLVAEIKKQYVLMNKSTGIVNEEIALIKEIEKNLDRDVTKKLVEVTNHGSTKVEESHKMIENISRITDDINSMAGIINSISAQTNILSINASIQAAHAGDYGKSFSVIADEVRTLASSTAKSSNNISKSLTATTQFIDSAISASESGENSIKEIKDLVSRIYDYYNSIENKLIKVSSKSEEILNDFGDLSNISQIIQNSSNETLTAFNSIIESMQKIKSLF